MTPVGPGRVRAAAAYAPLASLLAFALWLGPSQAGNRRWLDLGVEAMVLAGAATGLNILVGGTGLLSLGHAGFFVVGGYAGAILGPHLLGEGSLAPAFVVRNAPWFGPVFALLAGAGLGLVLALLCCHLRGFHLTVVTLGFGALVPAVVVLAADLFGGLGGRTVQHIPDTRNAFLARGHTLAGVYYTAVVYLLVALWLARNLARSRWGRAFTAVRDTEVAARTSGIDPYRHRVAAFAVSAGIVAVAGWVSALRTLSVSSGSALDVQTESFRYVITIALGGVATLAGPVVGAFVITFGLGLGVVQEYLRDKLGLVFGALALIVVVLAPSGLVGAVRRGVDGRRPPAPSGRVRPAGTAPAAVARRPERTEGGPAPGPLLSVRGLTRSFGGITAVRGLDLDVAPGTVHAVLGPNGSGKSTLVNLVTGVERAGAGRVVFAGTDITALAAHRRAALGMARTFQGLAVGPRMGVLETVLVGAHARGDAGLGRSLLGLAGAEERRLRARAADLLDLVGLGGRAGGLVGSLTLAERRLVELARALAGDPRLLLLDEPAAGLDAGDVAHLVDLVGSLRDQGLTVVLVEHHLEAVSALADHASVLHEGALLAQGPPGEVMRDARVLEAFIGPSR